MVEEEIMEEVREKKASFNWTEKVSYERHTLIRYTMNLIKKNMDLDYEVVFHLLSNEMTQSFVTEMKGKYQKEQKGLNEHEERMWHDFEDMPSLFNRVVPRRAGIKAILSRLETVCGMPVVDQKIMEERFTQIMEIFRLDRDEVEIVKYYYYVLCLNSYEIKDLIPNEELLDVYYAISNMTGVPVEKVIYCLKKGQRLMNSGIMNKKVRHDYKPSYVLDGSIIDFLSGFCDSSSLMEDFIRRDTGKALPIQSFSVEKEDRFLLVKLLKTGKPLNILLYGVPGSGKTEFTRALAREAGSDLYWLVNDEGENRNLRISLNAAKNLVGLDSIVCVDEADMFLNTRYFLEKSIDKGWLNKFLDASPLRMIWIANEIDNVEDSVLRRFDYSLCFKAFDKVQRIEVWKNLLKNSAMKKKLTEGLIDEYSETFQVNAAGIALAVKNVEHIYASKNGRMSARQINECLGRLLDHHQTVILGEGASNRKPHPRSLAENYDVEILNINPGVELIINPLKKLSAEMKNPKKTISGVNLLFYGLPGTGKTEFVRWIGKQLGMDVIARRYSDLESKYVGETEKEIASAFREAENSSSILFFDEADSLFFDRNQAQRSWEISRTNELLTQMEGFSGIFFCCTNLLNVVDGAAMRRFQFKVEFKPLQPEKSVYLFYDYFMKDQEKLNQCQKDRLMKLPNLTPGDFAAVKKRFQYLDGDYDYHDLIQALEQETRFRKQSSVRIGF